MEKVDDLKDYYNYVPSVAPPKIEKRTVRFKTGKPASTLWNMLEPPTGGLPVSFLWIGKRRMGRHFGLRCYLATQKKNIDQVFVFTNKGCDNFYKKFLPDQFIYPGWYPEVCRKIINYAGDIFHKEGRMPKIHIIFDNVWLTNSYHNIYQFFDMATRNRISCHFVAQKYDSIPIMVRLNCLYIVIYGKFTGREKELFLWENTSPPHTYAAIEHIDKFIEPELYTALVVERWKSDSDPTNIFKVFRAFDPKLKQGDIGSSAYWKAGTIDKKELPPSKSA